MIGDKSKATGFTIIEMLVAIAIFSFMVSVASGLFVSGFRNQRANLATQELLDQTSYLAEYMSRAIRMAKKDMTGACTGAAKVNYAFSGSCLKFVNYKNNCQQFCLDGTRLKDENGNYLTSANLKINNFNVSLAGQTQDDNYQPKATFFLEISGKEDSLIKIQTTISQRNLDVRK